MKAPAFWFAERSALAQLLRPAGFVWGAVAARRMARGGLSADVPVVTVGNFVAGGAGKTPAAIAIARLLIEAGEAPAFVARGYGGSASRGIAVRVQDQPASVVGDEPLLLARVAPTFVGADRAAASRAACETTKASVLVLDDGLQSRRVEPDLAVAVVDGASGTGNGLCIPAGPLRAPLREQLRHVHAVVIVGAGEPGEAVGALARTAGLPVFSARIAPTPEARALAGEKVVAFAGVGRPGKFFATLDEIGARIVARRGFADHHVYTAGEIESLRALAQRGNARLVTTEKDFARLPDALRENVAPVPVRMTFETEFRDFLLARLGHARR
jgi:tetraacyldisaccharide 4'-kinase